MDYSISKEIHQHELIEVSRWWRSLGLAEELKLLRDQPLKWYAWPMAMLTDPKMSQQRIELAKCISFVYVIDDIFDVYGTIEELTLFTQAVNRWELCAMMDLPEYMRSTYWANLCNAFLKEAKWFASGELPTADVYLKNGLVSSGVHTVLLHMLYLLGFGLTNQNSIYFEDSSAMASSVATILRLWDDLGSAKDENQEGNDGSYIECYMKGQKNGSIELTREYVVKQIEDEWKQVNKKHFDLMNGSLGSFSKASLNLARMVPLMYNYDDKQSIHVLLEYINYMLYDV
uniref:Linalool synthase n=1 Tax=Solanum tuberosum TaxID=4113 RepID=M1ASN4_SOLTU